MTTKEPPRRSALDTYLLACRIEPYWEEAHIALGFRKGLLDGWLACGTRAGRSSGASLMYEEIAKKIETWIADNVRGGKR